MIASDGTDTANASSDIEVNSDWPGTLNFTNCGQTGSTGPSQSQCDGGYIGTTLEGLVTLSSGIQIWTVPADGDYQIEVAGAQGGNRDGSGANGAIIQGTFTFTAGETVQILVGQEGTDSVEYGSTDDGGGGGGGTFIALLNNTPLIIAGGGGGQTQSYVNSAGVGQASTNGGCTYNSCAGMSTNGDGGANGITNGPGSGGGGFYTNGQASDNGSGDQGGFAFVNGGNGGTSGNAGGSYGGDGGFGGGGSGWHNSLCRSGGGGGYSGGQGATWSGEKSGGGGGSYNTGSNQGNQSGGNTGHGYVTIDKL